MKKITILFTLLTVTMSFGQNLAVNGDFETGASTGAGWQDTTSGYSYGTSAVDATGVDGAGTTHSGTYAGKAMNWSAAFQQGIDVTAGENYTISYWFTFSNSAFANARVTNSKVAEFNGSVAGSPAVFVNLTPVVADNGNNVTNATNYGCAQASGAPYEWKEASFSFTVPAGVTRVRFQHWNGNTNYLKYMDDFSIALTSSLSVKELAQFSFKSYPNPATNQLNLSADKNIDKIEIYNLIGQQLLNKDLNSNNTQVNVSSLSKGVYVVKAFIGDTEGSYKFIKE